MLNQALSPVVPFSIAVRKRVLCVHRPIRLLDRLFTDDSLGSASLQCDGIDATSVRAWKVRQRNEGGGERTFGIPSQIAVVALAKISVATATIAPLSAALLPCRASDSMRCFRGCTVEIWSMENTPLFSTARSSNRQTSVAILSNSRICAGHQSFGGCTSHSSRREW